MPGASERLDGILARLRSRVLQERVFLRVYAETAHVAAELSDRRRRAGAALGPLDGRIVSVKDVFDLAGEPTRVGSLIRRDAPAALADAVIVQRLRAAGAIILGKTSLTEFCFTSDGINRGQGTPGNAHDPARIPGGSSSGAGVSVAEGTSEIAIGSDTGGSVRIPAALNGVVGFKPTAARVPLAGVFSLSPSLDSVGPLARSVADCAAADAIMAGEKPRPPDIAGLSGLRIGVPEGCLLQGLDATVAAAFDACRRRLEGQGARVFSFDIEDLLEAMRAATRDASIASIEAAEIHADWLSTDTDDVDPRVSGPLSRRLAVPAWRYLRLMRTRRELAAAMHDRLSAVDVLALPTVPIVAPEIAPLLASDDLLARTDGLLLRNPQIVNQFDLTAISLPMPAATLPAGLMLVARNGHDRHLLAIAAAVERILA